jgi:hypothetical protein
LTKYFINPQYFLRSVLQDAAAAFARTGSIQLHNFLIPDVAQTLAKQLSAVPLKQHYVPDQYRCHEPARIPALAKQLQRVLATTHEMRDIISAIVQKKTAFKESCLCAYARGDYTLLHDKLKEPAGYDVIIDLTPHWDNRACGHHSYVDGKGNEIARVPVMPNALAIVRRPASVMKFVKYVNHHAREDKRIVLEARFS